MSFYIDVSNRALVRMQGTDVRDLLHRISTNDLAQLSSSQPIQTILTNEKGRIIDIVTVVDLTGGNYLLAGQTDNSARLAEWLNKFIIMEDARVEILPHRHFLIHEALSGSEITMNTAAIMFRERWGKRDLLHAVVKREEGIATGERLIKAGVVQFTGEEYEDYRIAQGIPAFPFEISAEVNPLELGLRRLISWSKGCYIGQEVIARLDTYQKIQRRLVGFTGTGMPDSLPVPLSDGKEEVGIVTSIGKRGAGEWTGLGFVKHTVPEGGILWQESRQGRQQIRFFSL